MKDSRPLAQVADDELLRRLADLVARSRRTESELVAHIAEVEARRLYAREASPSMFAYCTEVLHLSEAEAYLRICAARASREHPVLLAMLGDGRLHLSAVARLAPHLTPANRDRLLARAVHRSKRQILELVAELHPRPDVPDRVSRLRDGGGRQSLVSAGLSSRDARSACHPRPVPPGLASVEDGRIAAPATPVGGGALVVLRLADGGPDALVPLAGPRNTQLCPDTVQRASASSGSPFASKDAGDTSPAAGRVGARDSAPAASVEPLASGRYRVQFTAGQGLRDKLDRLRALLPLGATLDLASIIDLAVTEKIERLEARRFGGTRRTVKACAPRIERRDSAAPAAGPPIDPAPACASGLGVGAAFSPPAPLPVVPMSVAPSPVAPSLVTPAIVTPSPVTPSPVTPSPVTPSPVTASPVTASPVAPSPVAPSIVAPSRSRYIPAHVRRAVHRRDASRCTYEDDAGRRCSARGPLEFHHLHPFGMGGEHSARNVRLVCHAHNLYLAEIDYGRASLSRHRGRQNSP